MDQVTGKQILANFVKIFESSPFYTIKEANNGVNIYGKNTCITILYDEILEVKIYESKNSMIFFESGGYLFIFFNKYQIEIEG